MDYHYKAFISYRHAELDTKVAVEVQSRLERYRIPGSIRKTYGQKTIGRIFRDKDELPSTSDLNDNIKNAIRTSEYLICICSPRYIESIWCQKEIEFFLESHDKTHVLTVLAEGDPYEVVPEVLCKEMVTVQDENGNDVTVEAKLEPLSCDYRMERHRARTEELPRLAAVLIGCRYADLRQKMRHRRMRLTGLAAAVGAGLAGYFIWSYINIQNNYRQALVNQSQYLASSAQDALNNNDNLLAAQLSLAALPNEDTDRPVVPEAVYTLSRAVGAYQAKVTLNFRGAASYSPEGGTLNGYCLTEDARYLAIVSSVGDVDVYDMVEDTKLYTISTADLIGKPAYQVVCCGPDRFVIYDTYVDDIVLVRFSDGEILWHQRFEGFSHHVVPAGAGNDLILLMQEEILRIGIEDGEIKDRLVVSEVTEEQANQVYVPVSYERDKAVSVCEEDACCSIICLFETEDDEKSLTGIMTYFWETGKTVWTPVSKEVQDVEDLYRDEKGRILLTYSDSGSIIQSNDFYGGSYISASAKFDAGREQIFMLQEGSGEVLWEASLKYTGKRGGSYACFDIRTIGGEDGTKAREVVLGAVSNKIALYNAEDGSLIREMELSDEIISVEAQDPEEEEVRVNGADGIQYYFSLNDEAYSGLKFMDGDVDQMSFIHGRAAADGVSQFVVRQGSTIRVFKAEQGDDDYQKYGFEMPENAVSDLEFFGTKMLALDEKKKLYAYDVETEEKLWQTSLDEEEYYNFAGFSEDGTQAFFTVNLNEEELVRVNMADGSYELLSIEETDELSGAGSWDFDTSNLYLSGGSYVFFMATSYSSEKSYWFRYSMNDGTILIRQMPYYFDSSQYIKYKLFKFTEDGAKGLLFFDQTGYLADFETGEVTTYEASFPVAAAVDYREKDGMFALYSEGYEGENKRELHVYGADGVERWSIEVLPEKIAGMKFYKDSLILSTRTGFLYRYDAEDGTQTGLLNAGTYLGSSCKYYDDGIGGLIIDGDGTVLMIDYENWAMTGIAQNCMGFCPETKQIISQDTASEVSIGYCMYYSVDDLVKKGQRFVGEHTMSEKELTAYGLK